MYETQIQDTAFSDRRRQRRCGLFCRANAQYRTGLLHRPRTTGLCGRLSKDRPERGQDRLSQCALAAFRGADTGQCPEYPAWKRVAGIIRPCCQCGLPHQSGYRDGDRYGQDLLLYQDHL